MAPYSLPLTWHNYSIFGRFHQIPDRKRLSKKLDGIEENKFVHYAPNFFERRRQSLPAYGFQIGFLLWALTVYEKAKISGSWSVDDKLLF